MNDGYHAAEMIRQANLGKPVRYRPSWEKIASAHDSTTERLAVPGGWIYKHQRVCLGMQQPLPSLIFVADPSEQT